MFRNIVLSAVFLVIMVSSAGAADREVSYYYQGQSIQVPVNENKLLISFNEGIGPDEGALLILSAYSGVTYDTTEQLDIDGFELFGLSAPEDYDSIVASLESEDYVCRVNPVGISSSSWNQFIFFSEVYR